MINLVEKLYVTTIETIAAINPEEFKVLGRDPSTLSVKTPLRKITYDEAINILNTLKKTERKRKIEVEWGKGFTSDEEDILSESGVDPFFITDFPEGTRTIFMKPDPNRPYIAKSFDLIAPVSGEVASGGEIITDNKLLLDRLKKKDLPIARYSWYLDLMKHGLVEHAGFGMGLERFLMNPTGLNDIKDVSLLPRVYGESPEP
jgi:asparaginyl-tRNA synthetase